MKEPVVKFFSFVFWCTGAFWMAIGLVLPVALAVDMATIGITTARVVCLGVLILVGLAIAKIAMWLIRGRKLRAEQAWLRIENIRNAARKFTSIAETKTAAAMAESLMRKESLQRIAQRSGSNGIKVMVQGGSGWEFLSGKTVVLSMSPDELFLSDVDRAEEQSMALKDIQDVSIGGPGEVTKGGGAIGGGFGVEGFLVGAATASLINLLTTHTTTKTLVRIAYKNSEIFLLSSAVAPDAMRLYLSPVFARMTKTETTIADGAHRQDIVNDLVKLNELRISGAISSDEFALLKGKLLN